jgi:hypothetical protein
MPPGEISLHLVTRGVRLQEGHSAKERSDVTRTTPQRRCRHILQHVGTDYDIVTPSQRQVRKILESPKADVSSLPVPTYYIFARVQPEIPDPRSQSAKLGTPGSFPSSDIENRPHLSP